jgi:hypothetical protein
MFRFSLQPITVCFADERIVVLPLTMHQAMASAQPTGLLIPTKWRQRPPASQTAPLSYQGAFKSNLCFRLKGKWCFQTTHISQMQAEQQRQRGKCVSWRGQNTQATSTVYSSVHTHVYARYSSTEMVSMWQHTKRRTIGGGNSIQCVTVAPVWLISKMRHIVL